MADGESEPIMLASNHSDEFRFNGTNISIILVSLHRNEEKGAHPFCHRSPVVIGSLADDARVAVPSSRCGAVGC
jgi:hypothetical protein